MITPSYGSKYKKLIVSGCSFTHEPDTQYPFSWANIFGAMTGMDVVNLAVPGAGNTHISNSIILYLEQQQPKIEETLIITMWSGPSRFDWITDKTLSKFKSQYPFSYDYDINNELSLAGNWLGLAFKKNKSHLMNTMVEYSKYQSASSLALNSWLAMNSLTSYLKLNRYDFYNTSFLDYQTNSIDKDALPMYFLDELTKLNLSLDRTNWLDFGNNCYGDWAKTRGFLAEDKFHPKYPKANEGWVNNILIPALENKNIIFRLDSQ